MRIIYLGLTILLVTDVCVSTSKRQTSSSSNSSEEKKENKEEVLTWQEQASRSTDPTTFRFTEEVVLRVAAEEWIPHIAVSQTNDGQVKISGPMANLLDALAKSLNFKYVLVRPPDGAWGIPDDNGKWNGMIGMVKRNEADLALGPFGLTYSRSRVVTFSSPILIDYYRILIRRPQPEPDPWGFMKPYSWGVYTGLLLSLGTLSFILSIAWVTVERNFGYAEEGIVQIYFQQLWNLFGATFSQPLCLNPKSWSGRSVTSVWLITMLIVARSYSSSLTSLLAVRTVTAKYEFLEDLVQDPQVQLIFEKATALVEHFRNVKTGIYKELANTQQQQRAHFLASSMLFEAAYTDVREENFALLVEDTTCRKIFSDDFTKYGRCDFYMGKEKYWPLIFCIIGEKDNPLMNAVNSRIDRMISHDLYFKWLEVEVPNATACLKASSKVTVKDSYGLTGIWGLFAVFIGGILLSQFLLLFEISFNKFFPKKENDF